MSGSRGLCWAELNCSNVRSKSDNIVASEHCHNPRLCRYLHFLPHSQHNWQLCSPVTSPLVGLRSVKYLFIAGGLLCPGNVPGHAGEETRSYGLQLPRQYTRSRLRREKAPTKNIGKNFTSTYQYCVKLPFSIVS